MREQIGSDGVDRAQAQRPGQGVLPVPRHAADTLGLFQDPLGLLDDLATDRGHRHLAGSALEQGDAKLVLELAHSDAQCRLADETGLRGVPEMALARDRDHVAKLVERHSYSLRRLKCIAA